MSKPKKSRVISCTGQFCSARWFEDHNHLPDGKDTGTYMDYQLDKSNNCDSIVNKDNLRRRIRQKCENCYISPPPSSETSDIPLRRCVTYLIFIMHTFIVNLYTFYINLIRTNVYVVAVSLLSFYEIKFLRIFSPVKLKSKRGGYYYSVILSIIILCCYPALSEGFCPSACDCDDTSLSVNCENASLEVVPILLNPNVQTIILSRNRIHDLSQSLVFYRDLKRLDISSNSIATLGRRNFINQIGLAELRFSTNQLSQIETTALQGLVGLRALHLDGNVLTHIEEGAFAWLVSLEELNLSRNRLKSLGENILNVIPNLRTLTLDGNRFRDVPSSSFSNQSSLMELDLSNNQILQVPGSAFSGLAKLSRLVLDKNGISSIDPAAFSGLCDLKHLSLVDNRLLQVPSSSLNGLPELQHLDISGNLFERLPEECFTGLKALRNLVVSKCPRLSGVSRDAFLTNGVLETIELSHNPRLVALPPAALASLLTLRHLDLTACGLLHLKPTQVPLQQLVSLKVAGNPLHCNCSLVWLGRIAAQTNASLNIDQPSCASPPALYGVALRDMVDGGVNCDGAVGLWTVIICISVAAGGLAIIGIFLACCWWKKRKKKKKRKRTSQDKYGVWGDIWRPDQQQQPIAVTHLPPPPPPHPMNGVSPHYSLTSPSRVRHPPRLPPDHPLHHLQQQHHHHQGCVQQCPYAALHPVYHPLLHPDHNDLSRHTPSLYGDHNQILSSTHPLTVTSFTPPPPPPVPLNDPPNWYATIGGDDGTESGRGSRTATPLGSPSTPRKVPVTYV